MVEELRIYATQSSSRRKLSVLGDGVATGICRLADQPWSIVSEIVVVARLRNRGFRV